MKRKIIAMLMAMTMVMSLAACGKSDVKGTVVEAAAEESEETVEAPVEEETAEPEAEETKEAEAEEAVEETEEEAEEDAEESGEFSIGTVAGKTYVNEYFGIKINVPDGYSFVDDETLAQLTGMTSDMLSDNEAVKEVIEDGTVSLVCYAMNESGLCNINATIQSNALVSNMFFDEEVILSASEEEVENVLKAQGIENITYELSEREIAGDTHKVLKMSGDYSGVEFHNEMVNLQKGDYVIGITASCFAEDSTDELIDGIVALD